MKIFHWHLVCDICGAVFSPQEEDWDAGITCPACAAEGFICDGDGGCQAEEAQDGFAPADHPDWPQNLSDDELDQTYLKAALLTSEQLDKLEAEYKRRGRPTPTAGHA